MTAPLTSARSLPAAAVSGATIASPFWGILPPEFIDRIKDFFSYSVRFLPLASSGTLAGNFTVNNDSGFLLGGINVLALNAAGTIVIPTSDILALILLTDSGSGREIMSDAIPVGSLCGTGQRQGLLYWPKFVPPASTVKVTVTSLDVTNAQNLYFSFFGFKVFK